MSVIQETLRSLGVTRTYRGFRHVEKAIGLALENENRLEAVTKEIYQEVAEEFDCKWSAVERNIRTVVQRVWSVNKEGLIQIAGYPLENAPTASEFIEIITNYIQRSTAAKV